MPTIKRHKIWYILEGVRLWGGYKGDGENDHVYLPTQAWKDVNGNEYNYIYAGLYGNPRKNFLNYYNNPSSENLGYPYTWREFLANLGSFDTFTKVYASSDILQNWSRNDYLINGVGQTEFETNFNILETEDNIPYGQNSFYITIKNNTSSSLTVNSLKFTKNVCNIDASSQYADSLRTYTQNFINDAVLFQSEVIYASYFLDSPIIIEPYDEYDLIVNFTPDISNDHPNFKKSIYWIASESVRLANISENSGTMQYPATMFIPTPWGTEIYITSEHTKNKMCFPGHNGYAAAGNSGFIFPWMAARIVDDQEYNAIHGAIFSGTYGIKMPFISRPDRSVTDKNIISAKYNFIDQYSTVFNEDTPEGRWYHFTDFGSTLILCSFDQNIIPYPSNSNIDNYSLLNFKIDSNKIFDYMYESTFIFENGVYYRKFKIKTINQSSEEKLWTCIKLVKHGIPFKYSINLEPTDYTSISYDDALYGTYFFDTPIPIPPGEFRTVTLTVTPEDISIDVIIDDDEEEEEGEG